MKLNKKVILFIIIVIIIIGSFIGIYNSSNNEESQPTYNNLPLTTVQVLWRFPTDTPEKAIGISDYVFVAKINKIIRTEYKNPIEVETGLFSKEIVTDPYTVYEINVIENIKGNLKDTEPIEFMQYGGINEDEKSYTFIKNSGLLNVGEYYILLVDVFNDEGDIETSDPNRIISLGSNYTDDENSIISKYKEAYKNEIIPEEETFKKSSKYDMDI